VTLDKPFSYDRGLKEGSGILLFIVQDEKRSLGGIMQRLRIPDSRCPTTVSKNYLVVDVYQILDCNRPR
jgi:hypothetical protein